MIFLRDSISLQATASALLALAFTAHFAFGQTPTPVPQVRVITLQPHGFEPRQITASAGPVLVIVYNRSGFRPMPLRLSLLGAGIVREATVPIGKRFWRELVSAVAGTYVLTDTSRPGVELRITVTPTVATGGADAE